MGSLRSGTRMKGGRGLMIVIILICFFCVTKTHSGREGEEVEMVSLFRYKSGFMHCSLCKNNNSSSKMLGKF